MRSASESSAEAVTSPAPCATVCTPLATERAPLASASRLTSAARSAPARANALLVRPALTSTRFAATLTVGLRRRRACLLARFAGADARRLLPAALAAARLRVLGFARDLRAGRRFIFAIRSLPKFSYAPLSRRPHNARRSGSCILSAAGSRAAVPGVTFPRQKTPTRPVPPLSVTACVRALAGFLLDCGLPGALATGFLGRFHFRGILRITGRGLVRGTLDVGGLHEFLDVLAVASCRLVIPFALHARAAGSAGTAPFPRAAFLHL